MAHPTQELILRNPTHLFTGAVGAVQQEIVVLLQQILCAQHGCGYCAVCHGIYTRSSAHLLWLEPENNYTREGIEPIFDALSLQRATGDYFFVVITQAERLQHATANALLKSLEEPPCGYYFLLLTQYARLVLPTIRSRAILHTVAATDLYTAQGNKLYQYFTGGALLDCMQFLQELDRLDLSDQASAELFDVIMQALQHAYVKKQADAEQIATDEQKKLKIFVESAALLPQSGSSKIFWKNLYLKTLVR